MDLRNSRCIELTLFRLESFGTIKAGYVSSLFLVQLQRNLE